MPLSRLLRAGVPGLGAVLVMAALLLAACSTDKRDGPVQLDGWQQVALPDGIVPSSLQLTRETLLIGGFLPGSGGARAPALASLAVTGPDARSAPVPVTPATPYGKVADLMALTSSGDHVVALGAAHGGAHANFRWTIWTGSAAGVTDRPQTFETFGGWEAGTLLGLASDRRGPLVVGTWQGEHGSDGAIWRPDGERWVRQATIPALANTGERQVAPRTVSQQDDGSVVVNGSVIDLTDGVHQEAASWREVDADWTLTVLADPGKRSEAWSTACAATCWSVGSRDGRLAVWSDQASVPVPDLAATDTDTARMLLAGDRRIISLSSGGAGRLLVGQDQGWRIYTAPDGIVRAATLIGPRLFLVTGSEDARSLWVRDLSDVLNR